MNPVLYPSVPLGRTITRNVIPTFVVILLGNFLLLVGPVATPAASPSPLSIRVNGPQSAKVGSTVKYEIEVANAGTATATGLIMTDTFDAGLEHALSASLIERDLKDLQPGQSQKVNVSFRVTRSGKLCQQVEVRGAGNVRSSTRICLTARPATH